MLQKNFLMIVSCLCILNAKAQYTPPAKPAAIAKPAFDYNILSNLYRLQKVEALDINHKHSKKQMKAFILEAHREFESKDRAIDLEIGRMYIISRTDATRFGYFDFITNESYLESKNCKDCQDSRYKIISKTSSSLVLQIKPQDAGQFFVYQFTFIKL